MGKRPIRYIIVAALGSALLLSGVSATTAVPTTEETRKLLEKGLTIYELDREIKRLNEQEQQIARELTSIEQSIQDQQTQLTNTRKHAGKVVRAYYLGQRTNMWLLLLDAKSITDAIYMFKLFDYVLDHDWRAINRYTEARDELEQLRGQLNGQRQMLAQVKSEFISQRERLVELEREVEQTIARYDDAAAIADQMQMLTAEWEAKGLPLFRTYFKVLADTSVQLPDLLMQDEIMTVESWVNYTFRVTDEQLNEFLRQKHDLFHHFSFRIADRQIVVGGRQDDVEIIIKGRYLIEDNPKHAIRFVIDELIYNGFNLPDTTLRALEKDFPLAIYPEYFAASLRATAVTLEDNALVIQMKVDLSL